MAKREFLMLAHTYNPVKHGIGGYFMSEKLDGMRCLWDGGISRGLSKSEVPWANTDKDDRYINTQYATGLWSRYGNAIQAPDEWLDKLPRIPLDGELWNSDRTQGGRQRLMSTVKALEPDSARWDEVSMNVFDMPSYDSVFKDDIIKTTNFKKILLDIGVWIDTRNYCLDYSPKPTTQFLSTVKLMENWLPDNDSVIMHYQEQLPFASDKAIAALDEYHDAVVRRGGEGLILRKPESCWIPERSHNLLKVKKCDDAEGTVTGYITGRQTDLGSKLLGKMGALILQLDDGNRLELSGFTDEERMLTSTRDYAEDYDEDYYRSEARTWAEEHPETECPDWIEAVYFPRGSRVTFKYRGLSADGIPQEARYWRQKDD